MGQTIMYDENISKINLSTNRFPEEVTGIIWYFLIDDSGSYGRIRKINAHPRHDWSYHVKLGPCFELGSFMAELKENYWVLSKKILYSHIQLHERSLGKVRKDNAKLADRKLKRSVLEYIEAISFETGLPFMREPQLIDQRLKTG